MAACSLALTGRRFMEEPCIRRLGESEDVTLLSGSKHPLVQEFRDEWRLRWATEKGAEQS